MKKRAISLILALVLVFGMIPVTARAATLSNGLEYTVVDNTAMITGYVGNATSVTIPSKISGYPVTYIGWRAFYLCDKLTSITIPNSVTCIQDYAFYDCDGLTSITIPNSVTYIGWYAFSHCDGLTSITIPDTVIAIGSRAFSSCNGLTSVTIPNSVTEIGDFAFYGCDSLTSVYFLGDAPKDIGYCSICKCDYITAYYPAGNSTWTGDVMQEFGGYIIWVPYNKVKITLQPKTAVAATGTTAKVSVNATGDGLTYQWYFKNAGDSKFYLTNSFKGNSYSMTMDDSRNGRQVYCVITDKYGNAVKTNTVTLKMATLTITKQSGNVTVAKGQTATAYVNVSGEGLTFKWYYKNAGDSKFYLTNSFKSNVYSVAMDASRNGRQVYCVISDKYGNTVKTNPVTLKMAKPLTITKQSGDVTVAKGQTATAYVNVTGEGLSFKWYYKNPGDSKFYLTNSFKSNVYSVAMDASRNGRQVYCVISDKYGNTVATSIVSLKMK